MTLLFFPDWTNGLPSDFLILHFFVGAVIFPFNMIHAKARKIDSQNPQEAANGYKNSDNATFFGYEEINYAVSTNKESLEDKKIRTKKEYLQKEKIGKLFPKKK